MKTDSEQAKVIQ